MACVIVVTFGWQMLAARAEPARTPLLKGTGVAMSASALEIGARKYVPEYLTGVWSGNLRAYELGALGQQLSEVWNAEARLPPHADRNIFVGTRNGTPRALPFKWSDMGTTLQGEMGTAASASLVNFLRGDRTQEGLSFRRRSARLGDIVNSQPVYVKDLVNMQYSFLPEGSPGRDTYRTFLAFKKARKAVVFVGGNDGMVHAFRDSDDPSTPWRDDGREAFAFIPRALLPSLNLLAANPYEHRYYVDGPLVESDAHFGGGWHNVLIGTTGAGARVVYALDVTNPSSMDAGKVLWEFDATSDPELGHVLAAAEIGLMKNGDWAAIFGNGVESASGRAQLFVVNLQTGALIRKIDTATGDRTTAPNGLGGVRVIRDDHQVIVGAYAGDLLGNVWMFDLVSTSSSGWKVSPGGSPLYKAVDGSNGPQPISAAPQFVPHPKGGFMVLVGTGKLFEESDRGSTQVQSLYGLWDKRKLAQDKDGVWQWLIGEPTSDRNTLVAQSIDSSTIGAGVSAFYTVAAKPLDWRQHRGWTLPLTIASGQRSVFSPQFLQGWAFFQTLAPTRSGTVEACNASGNGCGYNLFLDPINGRMATIALFDTDGSGEVDAQDRIAAGYRTGADGREVVHSQRPGAQGPGGSPCPSGSKLASVQGASSDITTVCYADFRLRTWRQIVQFPQ